MPDISQLKTAKGMALADLVTGIYDCLSTYKLPAQSRIYLLDHLAQIEHRLSTGASEKIQLSALLGGVKIALQISQNKV